MTTSHALPASAAGRWMLGGDLDIARIGYGSMKLTGWPMDDPRPDHDTALAVLRLALELGVNHIDTCHYYSHKGVSANRLIKEALHPYPSDLAIVTKVGPILEGDETYRPGERVGLTPDGLRRAIEANLTELGVDGLDVVNLRMDYRVTPEEGSLPAAMETLAGMREEGLIRHLGISNVSLRQFEEARRIAPIVCVQNHYNLTSRKHDPIVDLCTEAGIAFVPFYPVSRLDEDAMKRLTTVAERHNATARQVALAWLLARSPAMLLIAGTGSPEHLRQNIDAGRLRLTAADLAELG